jgi:hypothetical protein
MLEFNENLSQTLKRYDFIFRNQEISTECIKDYDGFSIFGQNYGPFEKGKKYKLKFFIGIVLIEYDILKLHNSEKCDSMDIQRFAVTERDDIKLVQRKELNILTKLKNFRRLMEKDVKDLIKPKIDLDRYNSYLISLIDTRLLKLLKLAKSDLSLDDEQRLTETEKILYDIFFKIIKFWREFFLTK